MGLVVSQFKNPWGAASDSAAGLSFQPARPDLWELDFSLPATTLPNYLQAAYAAEPGLNSSAQQYQQLVSTLTNNQNYPAFLARSVQLPKRNLGVGALVRRDNAPFESPGYRANVGRVEITFIHELSQTYGMSYIWALLTAWRAFARAGEGPDFPGSPDIFFGLVAAASAAGNGNGLISPYRYDFAATLLMPSMSQSEDAGDAHSTANSLTVGPGYIVKNAWPVEFGMEPLSYENGKGILEIKASFQCDDVVPETGSGIGQGYFHNINSLSPYNVGLFGGKAAGQVPTPGGALAG